MKKSKDTANAEVQPKNVSKDEADKLQDYAQGLDDEVTHVVDYGDLKEK